VNRTGTGNRNLGQAVAEPEQKRRQKSDNRWQVQCPHQDNNQRESAKRILPKRVLLTKKGSFHGI
jgi:hypothetical protein